MHGLLELFKFKSVSLPQILIAVLVGLLFEFSSNLSGLRQILTTESLLKMMKKYFYFILKALFVLEIFTFLSWFFGYVEKRLDKKFKVNSKIYDVTDWSTNNYSLQIVQYLKE